MKLATIRTPEGPRAVKVDGDTLLDLGAPDLGAFLAAPGWRAAAEAAGTPVEAAGGTGLAPVVPAPSKVVCVGLNYRNHIREMGRDLPEHPTLFPKFADTLTGAYDDIVKPAETDAFDWEVELAVVIGRRVRRAGEDEAAAAIAGFTVLNDITARDWQFRTVEWTQGKIWDSTTPVGPHLVTPDEVPGGVRPAVRVTTGVDGRTMQDNTTEELVFDPVDLVRYVSTVTRLNPGDIIATGTPGGVGHARDPKIYLQGGERVVTAVEGVGRCENTIVKDGR
ncbi:fumarylacetoacetate hydrolase family protein [Streptomonospora sp. PA3]|uniref:fumarylacetoacetate hydrolase family protein n=1 Tax=Streptomonospora sp. PA3 TaxID=2607326 RepID=UPI0012DC2B09|nr:fumarylacetoacetate hydrolase family protein [Streptomonospora sp. PA3]MUL41083.1 fumarylacetoacetate hydrolase family protein [Streptomonospora sp. PA3]